ncbi:MAG: hypothetical protein KC912_11930 [Proteobacteria bacterium]|nr:hypothetical protein [Pseudomonadota bacterium]
MKKLIGAVLVLGVMGVGLLLLGVLVAGGTYLMVGSEPEFTAEEPGLEAVLGRGDEVAEVAEVAPTPEEPEPAAEAPKPAPVAARPSPSPSPRPTPRKAAPRPAPAPTPVAPAPEPEPEPDPLEELPEDEAESLDEVMNDFVIEDLDTEPEPRKRRRR